MEITKAKSRKNTAFFMLFNKKKAVDKCLQEKTKYLITILLHIITMEERLYYTKDKDMFLNNEDLKLKGFSFENSVNVDYKDEGYVFLFKADKEWFDKMKIEKMEGVKEITEKADKEKILKKMSSLDEDVTAGIGGLF
ncbi:MAG: hypothetical protein PHI86_07180 [Candidatus Omnitrophica bacterium]|nr:hypothetical protein [Candidatus Omnitrophota bacterium]